MKIFHVLKIFGRSKGYEKCWFNASEITTICKLTQDKVIVIIVTEFERNTEKKRKSEFNNNK